MNAPKNQHFVSAVYLRRFCDADGRIHTYDLEKKEFRSNKPENVATKKHIYTITHNGAKDVRIEEFMSEIETNYGEIIKKIEEGSIEQLDNHDLENIVWFISFLYARNLSMVNRFSKISEELLSFVGNSLLDYNLQQESSAYLRPYLKLSTNPEYTHKMAMDTMFVFAGKMYKLLTSEGNWFFYKAQPDTEFITTDDPMGKMVMVPLSKNILFMRVTENIEGLSKSKKVLPISPE